MIFFNKKTKMNSDEFELVMKRIVLMEQDKKILEVKIDDCITKSKKLNLKFNAFLREEEEEENLENDNSLNEGTFGNIEDGRHNPLG